MISNIRHRQRYLTTALIVFFLFTVYFWRRHPNERTPLAESVPAPPQDTSYPKYKPTSPAKSLPIVDNFPLAAAAHSAADLPPIPSWVRPPSPHIPEKTPLFIGFTRNWRLLQQVVVAYITGGWPPEDIYVIENTGVMDSNKQGRLSLQNPFFLNHTRLHMFGVNVVVTPTLLTFAQLQNFYLSYSIDHDWQHYFWSHMDIVALPFEDRYIESYTKAQKPVLPPSDPKHDYSDFKSIYDMCVDALRVVLAPRPAGSKERPWSMRFFSYDRLALVNVASFVSIGGWDTLIPFYMTDCDMHARLDMAGYDITEVPAAFVYDVASSMDDLIAFYRKKGVAPPSFTDPNQIEQELALEAEREKNRTEAAGGKIKSGKEIKSVRREEHSAAAWENTVAQPPASNTKWEEDEILSQQFRDMLAVCDRMSASKHSNSRGRNTWQSRQVGGKGDPFYRDSEGFEAGILMTIEHGKRVFAEKWGHRDCDIVAKGLKQSDAWRVEHDW